MLFVVIIIFKLQNTYKEVYEYIFNFLILPFFLISRTIKMCIAYQDFIILFNKILITNCLIDESLLR